MFWGYKTLQKKSVASFYRLDNSTPKNQRSYRMMNPPTSQVEYAFQFAPEGFDQHISRRGTVGTLKWTHTVSGVQQCAVQEIDCIPEEQWTRR
jgi:hypothetical protein